MQEGQVLLTVDRFFSGIERPDIAERRFIIADLDLKRTIGLPCGTRRAASRKGILELHQIIAEESESGCDLFRAVFCSEIQNAAVFFAVQGNRCDAISIFRNIPFEGGAAFGQIALNSRDFQS